MDLDRGELKSRVSNKYLAMMNNWTVSINHLTNNFAELTATYLSSTSS
jgi:hypothetical protein